MLPVAVSKRVNASERYVDLQVGVVSHTGFERGIGINRVSVCTDPVT